MGVVVTAGGVEATLTLIVRHATAAEQGDAFWLGVHDANPLETDQYLDLWPRLPAMMERATAAQPGSDSFEWPVVDHETYVDSIVVWSRFDGGDMLFRWPLTATLRRGEHVALAAGGVIEIAGPAPEGGDAAEDGAPIGARKGG